MELGETHPAYKPAHYQLPDGKESIDIIARRLRELYGPDAFKAYCAGCAMKYAHRQGKKGQAELDEIKIAMYRFWLERDPEVPSQCRLQPQP